MKSTHRLPALLLLALAAACSGGESVTGGEPDLAPRFNGGTGGSGRSGGGITSTQESGNTTTTTPTDTTSSGNRYGFIGSGG